MISIGLLIASGVSLSWGQDRTESQNLIPIRNLKVSFPETPFEKSNSDSLASPDPTPVVSTSELLPLTDKLKFDGPPREMTLQEAIQIALQKSDVVLTLGSGSVQIDSTTRFDPEIMQIRADVAETVFDPRISAGYIGSDVNEPEGTFFGPGIAQNVVRNEGNFTAALSKAWSTGATTTVGYLPPLGYLFYPDGASGFNPVYTSDLVFMAQQPLLRGAGFGVNTAPIRIAQMRAEQSTWDFKQTVLAQVRSVETAYWDLQAGLSGLDALESILPLMTEIVRIEDLRAQQELSTSADVARVTMQLDQLQQQRLSARSDVMGKELRLRNLLALDLSDGTRLYPIERPRDVGVQLDHAAAVANAIENRPDLVRQRLGVKIREWEYAVAKNGTRPQLDLQALYRSNGIGQALDASLQQMTSFAYKDWTLGITYSIPIGNRAARANLKAAEFQLARERAILNQAVQNVSFNLADMTREAEVLFSQYTLAVRRTVNSKEWMKSARIRYSTPPPMDSGSQNWLLLALYDYQNALRMHVDAIGDAAQLLARYNTQLARIEEAQGILLENRGIDFRGDPCTTVQNNSDKLFANDEPLYPVGSRSSARRPSNGDDGQKEPKQDQDALVADQAKSNPESASRDEVATTSHVGSGRYPAGGNHSNEVSTRVNDQRSVKPFVGSAPLSASPAGQTDSRYAANYRHLPPVPGGREQVNSIEHGFDGGVQQGGKGQGPLAGDPAYQSAQRYNSQTINRYTAAGKWDEGQRQSNGLSSRQASQSKSAYLGNYRQSPLLAEPVFESNPANRTTGSMIQQAAAQFAPNDSGSDNWRYTSNRSSNPQTIEGNVGTPGGSQADSPYSSNYRGVRQSAAAEWRPPDRTITPTNYSTYRVSPTAGSR